MLSTATQRSCEVAGELDSGKRFESRQALDGFVRLYAFLSQSYGADLGDGDMLKVAQDVRDAIRDTAPQLEQQAANNSREDFVRDRDHLLIDAALSVDGDRDRQAALLKAFLDDDDFRARAGHAIFGAIYDGYRAQPGA